MESKLFIPDIKWRITSVLKIMFTCIGLAFVFYDSLTGCIFVLPVVPLFWICEKRNFIEDRRRSIKEDFKDFLMLLSGNLGAGYSLENSFCHSCQEYRSGYKDSLLFGELQHIVKGLEYNKRLEDMLIEFGEKTRIKEIEDFAELIVTAKIYGGNIIKLIKQTADNYRENSMTELEINTMIASKKMESRVMLLAPVLIVVYMRLTNGEYMNVLYETGFGGVVMTICMYLLILAFVITNKIIKIGV